MKTNTADTILQQLGGNHFIAMTGAKWFIADRNSLSFTIGRNSSKANRVKVTLNGDDTYTMTFAKFVPYTITLKNDGTSSARKESYTVINESKGLYYDMLQSNFTAVTGLYTHL